jgi:hypothetical protein
MFLNLAEQLVLEGKLQGSITGGKQLSKAIYIPNAYAKAQGRWIDDFLAQNSYLEYDALRRLGFSDPESGKFGNWNTVGIRTAIGIQKPDNMSGF